MLADTAFRARVAGVEFTGRRFRHEPGLYVSDVDGLLSGGDVRSTSIALADGDGEYDLPNQRTEPRIITLTGFAYASSMRELGEMIRRLNGLLAGKDARAAFTWEEFGETWHTYARRGAGSRVSRRGATGFADFTARFRAPSQRYYGDVQRLGPAASFELVHRGNYDAQPTFEVAGPHSGFTITGPGGRAFTVTQAASAGQVHRVSMRTGQVRRNGALQTGVVSAGYVFSVPPGAAPVPVRITGAQASVLLADSYV